MKRKFILAFLAVMLFIFCAFDWPPEPYEMPRTVLTTDVLKDSLSGLTLSIRSVANTGLNILGVLFPVFIIIPLFDELFLKNFRMKQALKRAVSKNEFSRAVRAADRAKNMEAIIDDRVAEMEISNSARKKFRQLHPEADLEERIYQKELSYSAQIAFLDNHPDMKKRRRRR